MQNQQKAEEFWKKLTKSCAELQHDFEDLDPQDKEYIKNQVEAFLRLHGIFTGVDTVMRAIESLKR